jgi:K+-transporting ATPase ATPase A chain
MANPGAHGLSEVLYAFASMANNNGSAFAGLSGNTIFYNLTGCLAMLLGRFVPAVAMLAMAGSLAEKKYVPPSLGTLPTDKAPFALWLALVIIVVGALTFFPALPWTNREPDHAREAITPSKNISLPVRG